MRIFSALASHWYAKQLSNKMSRIYAAPLEPFEGWPAPSLARTNELHEYVRRAGEELGIIMEWRALPKPADQADYDFEAWAYKVAAEMFIIRHLYPTDMGNYHGVEHSPIIQDETTRLIGMLAAFVGLTPDELHKDEGVQDKLTQAGYPTLAAS